MELLKALVQYCSTFLEFLGVGVIVVGALYATVLALLLRARSESGGNNFRKYRRTLGQSILLGLEFLVAADIIKTVAIEPTLQSVAVLGSIVLIRTFLSFALEVEMTGRWPWQGSTETAEPVARRADEPV